LQVNALVAAASDQHLVRLHVVQFGEPLDQGLRLWFRVAVQQGFPVNAIQQGPRGLVGVEEDALSRRFFAGGGIRSHGDDFGPCQGFDAHAGSPAGPVSASSRDRTAMRWASRPSTAASVSAVGPTRARPSRLAR
jgi:hypothetical protein